jgi:glycerol transport system ATP-binding protein
MANIELRNIAHSYDIKAGDPTFALHPFSLNWEDGGTYALLGPSGCGKSTMLNVMSGLVTPSHGELLIDGQNVTQLPTTERNIAQVFQFPVIYQSKTVYENLAFPLRCRKMKKSDIDRKVREVAELLNLTQLLSKPAHSVTVDTKQLISLGRGLVRDDVSAILMDEPLTVIDPQLKFELRRKLKEVSARHGHTLIYVTHDQNEAMTLADQVVVMDQGRIMQMGTPQELFENPSHTYVGYFIGSPAMNFIDCRLSDNGVHIDEYPVSMKINDSARSTAFEMIKVGIRPEFISFSKTQQKNAIPVSIIDIQNLGKYLIATAAFGNQLIKAKLPSATNLSLGATNAVLAEEKLRLYIDNHLCQTN